MCGIGAVAVGTPDTRIERWAETMSCAQAHRGPDNQSARMFGGGRAALAHARLSIVDLSPLANQPMSNEDGNVWVVCNGEIYNHPELRRSLLSRGHQFRSQSDTETLVHLYEEYGETMVEHLHGMFAFALYDVGRDVMFCARDRLGKKPLVYAEIADGVALASEIPVLIEAIGSRAIDPVSLGMFFLRNVRHVPDPMTIYQGVRRLMPGHAMRIEHGRITRIWRYWRPRFDSQPTTPAQVLEEFDRAVEMRRVADVEVGALLSGGVDSSAIVHAMMRQGSGTVRTYAMGYGPDDDELVRARRMANLLKTEHREFYFDPDRQHDHFEHMLARQGEPIMLLPLGYTYELCLHIRDDGIRVVMTGHGADEIFYGYPGHNATATLSRVLPFVPTLSRPLLRMMATRFAPGSRLREALLVAGSPAGDRKAALYRDEARRTWATLFRAPSMVPEVDVVMRRWLGTWFEDGAPEAYVDEASILGLMHENSHSVTIAGDLPAMAASVEARAPFLDQTLVEHAWRIHYARKVGGRWGKRQNKLILKQALAERLPADVLYAPKKGFGYHIQEADVLRGPWRERVRRAFREGNDLGGLLDMDQARAIERSFYDGGGASAIMVAKLYAAMRFASLAL